MKPNPAPPEWLTALGIASPCISNNSSANERGRSFSIRPLPGDVVWRVHVDGCWFIGRERRVDYLFWARSSTGRRRILLVELKGKDFGSALQQVEASL